MMNYSQTFTHKLVFNHRKQVTTNNHLKIAFEIYFITHENTQPQLFPSMHLDSFSRLVFSQLTIQHSELSLVTFIRRILTFSNKNFLFPLVFRPIYSDLSHSRVTSTLYTCQLIDSLCYAAYPRLTYRLNVSNVQTFP